MVFENRCKKKMSILQNLQRNEALNSYLPAVLKKYKTRGWVVEYYALHPQSKEMKRIQIRINRVCQRYATKSEAKAHALTIVNNLNAQLSGGWTPFFDNEDSRLFVKLSEVCRLFLSEYEKEKREGTMRSYRSFCKRLLEYCDKVKAKDIYASLFKRGHAVRFIDSIQGNNSPSTYNSMIKIGRVLFNWSIDKMYVKENPFETIKLKKKQKKKRTIIPPEVRQQISEYFLKNNPNFLTVCELVYFSLIRPNEIKNLRVGDIDFERGCVKVSGEFAKNHNTRYSALSNTTIERLRVMIHDVPKDYYIFGGAKQNCLAPVPSKIKLGAGNFSKQWEKVRNALKLPAEYQLYSFRDTGIFEMLKAGVDNLTVMQHADHSSLDITTIYANHADPKLIERVRSANVKF
jgi:integrase